MPWLGMGGALAAAALLAFEADRLSDTAMLYAVGTACRAVTFVILVAMSRPIDKKITRWVENSFVERDYLAARERWNRLMFTRGSLGIVALACFVGAPLT